MAKHLKAMVPSFAKINDFQKWTRFILYHVTNYESTTNLIFQLYCIILWSSEIMLVPMLVHLLRLTFGFYPKKQGLFFDVSTSLHQILSDALLCATSHQRWCDLLRSNTVHYVNELIPYKKVHLWWYYRSRLLIDFTARTLVERLV